MARSAARTRRRKSFVQRNTLPLIFVSLGALVLIGAGFLALASGGATNSKELDFTLNTPNGERISLSDYRGKTVAVNFWATWCPPCRAEMPSLDQYYREHMNDDFVLLAVNVGESPDVAQSFIQQGGFSFPIALDPRTELADRIGATGFPTTLIVNPQGQITYRHTGMITVDILDAKVREARSG